MSAQLQVSGEAKIRDIQGPVVANDGVITALDGAASQYVRGDGTLADFPTSSGGGSSVSYYLNSSVSQGTIGGVAYRELSKEPIIGAGTDITISANGYVASYITDANDPDVVSIPGGNFNCEFYFSVNNNTGNPYTYAELYKYDGTTFTLLGSNVGVPEYITQGTVINPYYFAIPVPTSALALTDRLAIRIYVNVSGRTITLHTENGHLCQVVTTLSKGMVSLNNLTDQSQFLTTGTSGTNFAIVSSGDTHTFNLPIASASNTGKLSSTDWSTFNAKQPAGNYVTLDTTQTITGLKTFNLSPKNETGIQLKNDIGIVPLIDGYTNLNGLSNGLAITNSAGVSNNLLVPSTTGYSYTFPATSGTIALTSNLSSYVPYTGATTNVDLGTNNLSAKTLTANGNAGSSGSLHLKQNDTINVSGVNYGTIATNTLQQFVFYWENASFAKRFNIDFSLLTPLGTARTYSLPDANGTLALTSDISYPVTSVFGRTGAVVATSGDYSTTLVTEGTNLYFTDGRARGALSFTAGSGAYNSTTGVITIPTNNNQITNGSNFITLGSLSGGTGISYNNTTGVITNSAPDQTVSLTAGAGISISGTYPSFTIASTITQYTDALARAAISLTTTGTSGAATYNSTTGVFNIPQYTDQYVGTVTSVGLSSATSGVTIGSSPITTSGTITLAIATASGSQNGLLSSTDWTTFNNKQAALTNPVTGTGTTNYLPKFTGASTIGNSLLRDDGTYVSIGTAPTSIGMFTVYNGSGSTDSGVTRSSLYLYAPTANANVIRFSGAIATDMIFGRFGNYDGLSIGTTGGTEIARFTSSGNLGLGVTPSAWGSSWKALEGEFGQSWFYNNGALATGLVSNTHNNGTNWIYKTPNAAFRYELGNVGHAWFTAPVGTINNAISFTQAMTLGSNGNLGLGTNNSSVTRLLVKGVNTSSSNYAFVTTDSADSNLFWVRNDGLSYHSNNVLIGTTTDAGYKLDVNGTGRFTSSVTSTQNVIQQTTDSDFLALKINHIPTTNSNTTVGYIGFYSNPGNGSNNTLSTGRIYGKFDANSYPSARLTFATVTASDTYQDVMTLKDTNVGIGTSSPSTTLTVYKTRLSSFLTQSPNNLYLQSQGYDGNGYNTIDFGSISYGVPLARIGVGIFGDGTYMSFGTSNNYTTGLTNTAMTINPTGNVGIGTTSPSSKLTIQSNSTQLRLETASDPSSYYSFIESNYNAANPLNIFSSAAASYAFGTIALAGISGVNTYVNSYYGLIFGTGSSSISSGTVRGMVTGGGNWLIGTTTDSGEKLQVNGITKTTGLSLSGTTVSTSQTMTSSYYMWIFNGGSGQTLTLYSSSGHNNTHFIKNSSANSLTLAATNIETLTSNSTVSSITIPAYKTVMVISNGGSVWIVMNQS